MRLSLITVFLTFVLALAFGSSAAATSTPSGSWSFAGTPTAVSAMEASLERATSELNFVVRGIARSRLRDECRPWDTLRIERTGNRVLIAAGSRTIASPLGVQIRRDSAEGDMLVRRFFKGDALVEHMAIDKGSRINVYHVRGDHVRVDSTIKSRRLASPIKFSYTYR